MLHLPQSEVLLGSQGAQSPGSFPRLEYINDGESQQKYIEHEFISTQELKKFAPHSAPSLTLLQRVAASVRDVRERRNILLMPLMAIQKCVPWLLHRYWTMKKKQTLLFNWCFFRSIYKAMDFTMAFSATVAFVGHLLSFLSGVSAPIPLAPPLSEGCGTCLHNNYTCGWLTAGISARAGGRKPCASPFWPHHVILSLSLA